MLIGRWLSGSTTLPIPWGSAYGLARSLIALGTLLTLVFSDAEALFRPVRTMGRAPFCEGVSELGVFCLVPRGSLDAIAWVCSAILLIVVLGWRPQVTGVLHWYVSFSLVNNIAIPDGGDQIAMILTLLLIPVTLGDRRRWHWSSHAGDADHSGHSWRPSMLVAGVCCLIAAKVQVAGIYLHSSLGKLAVPEWVDGTALYYWVHHAAFGAPPWADGMIYAIVATSWGVLLMTWIPILIEFTLAISLVMSPRVRRWLLPIGVVFHVSIGIVMGLGSFSLVMIGALILLLLPVGASSELVDRVRNRTANVTVRIRTTARAAEATTHPVTQ